MNWVRDLFLARVWLDLFLPAFDEVTTTSLLLELHISLFEESNPLLKAVVAETKCLSSALFLLYAFLNYNCSGAERFHPYRYISSSKT